MNNDLISREALKKEVENLHSIYTKDKEWFYTLILVAIDNAPTVDIPNCGGQVVPDMLQGWRYEERQKGEWIANPLGDYVCNKCSWIVGKFERNFCPNCGAKMKGGAENE